MGRARVLHEGWVEAVVDGGRDRDLGAIGDARGEGLGLPVIGVERQVWAMLFRLSAQWHHHHGVRSEKCLRFDPGDVAEELSFPRRSRPGGTDEDAEDSDKDQAHPLSYSGRPAFRALPGDRVSANFGPNMSDEADFKRIAGRRQPPTPGQPPSAPAREAMARMANYLTRAPKGVFIYRSHEEANRDQEAWLVEAMVARHR